MKLIPASLLVVLGLCAAAQAAVFTEPFTGGFANGGNILDGNTVGWSDGRTLNVYRHATQRAAVAFGEGNQDGHAAPGETFAVLLPEGDALRAAELFTNDTCVDKTLRASDSWNDYDHAGASAAYSLPTIRAECPPGHVVHMLARILIPNAPRHQVRYAAIEIPVWWKPGEEPKK